jgi:hypothetical protein
MYSGMGETVWHVPCRSLESAKKKTLTELSRSTSAADSIAALLDQLNSLLTQAATAANDTSSSSSSSPGLMSTAKALICAVNDLRLQVLKQAQALQYVQSTSLQLSAIPLDLEGDVTPLGADSAAAGAASGTSSKPAVAAGTGSRGSSANTAAKGGELILA